MTLSSLGRWAGYFLAWTVGITLAGMLLGLLVFPLVGLFADTGRSAGQLAVTGVKTLGFYFGIWAPGTALVFTCKRAYESRSNATATAADLTPESGREGR